jgi:type IV secretory pathway component VirB8
MFPLNRPQIFFLTTFDDNQNVQLTEMQTDSANLDNYKIAFVQEYIRFRNEISADTYEMHKKWNTTDGAVYIMSTDDIFSELQKTKLFYEIMSNELETIPIQCVVSFFNNPEPSNDTYKVSFRHLCKDNTGRTYKNDYKIRVELQEQDGSLIRWADRIENPLGLKVKKYEILEGDNDPLNVDFLGTQ